MISKNEAIQTIVANLKTDLRGYNVTKNSFKELAQAILDETFGRAELVARVADLEESYTYNLNAFLSGSF